MKKLLLLLIPFLFTISAYSQNGYSSVFLRVTDSATFVNSANTTAKHAANYADIWYSVSSGLFWKWSTVTNTYTMISEGGNFWKNAGPTTLTGNVLIDGGTNDIFIDTDGDWRFGNSNSAIYTDIGANQMLWYSNAFSFLISGTLIDIQSPGNGAGVVVSANDVAIGATDDVNISAGPTGSAHDVNISSAAGHIHLQTGAAGILLDPAGPITINTDPGTAGDVLQSNGAGAPPTWVAPTGGGTWGSITGTLSSQTDLQAALDLKSNALVSFKAETASHTLDADDLSDVNDGVRVTITMNVASANNLTIPLNSSQAFPVGSEIKILQIGVGQTSIVATGGVTINSANGWLNIAYQYASVTLTKSATDTWYVTGTLVP